jgi:glycosyltransferase involved in cell wall biosynthesis
MPYARRIYAEVARAGLSSFVDFLGEVPEDRLCSLFREADAFVFPNSPQTWGLAVFQAMACGTPAIVSRGAGASEVLTHGKNAILVDPFSPAQIADAVERLRENEGLWESLHVEGRRFVEENIRWDLYAERVREVFSRFGHRP